MKKVSLFCLSMLFFGTAFGQFEQGTMLVGGGATLSVVTDKVKVDNTTTVLGNQFNFGLTPQFGYFLMDNLAVGAQLQIGATSFNEKDGDDKTSTFDASIGPFARYYFDPGIFVEGAFGLGTSSSKNTNGTVTTESSRALSLLRLGGGYAFFLNDNVAVEPMLFYQTSTRRVVDSDPVIRNKEGGLYLQVGLQVYLGK